MGVRERAGAPQTVAVAGTRKDDEHRVCLDTALIMGLWGLIVGTRGSNGE